MLNRSQMCVGVVAVGLLVLTASGRPAAAPAPAVQGGATTPVRTAASIQAESAALSRRIPQLLTEGMVPGLAIALVRDGRVVWVHGFGVARADTKEPVGEATVFEAASLSKPVFAYAVLKLVDRGVLDLDTPLTRYLPGTYDVVNDPRIDQITARHVLSHRTGFPNWRSGPRDTAKLTIHFTPGERFSYSGEGFVYLAKVVEYLTKQPLEAFMQATVFEPLGMASSSYVWQDRYEPLKAFNHDALGQLTGRGQPKAANAAASLHTTAGDYARFVAAVLNGTGLAPATAQAMLSSQIQLPDAGYNTIDKAPGRPMPALAWGLGWGLQRTKDGPSFWHWGDNGNNRAFIVAYERPKSAMVVFTNGANGLLLMPELIRAAVGGQSPALTWLDSGSLGSPSHKLLLAIVRDGAPAALAQLRAAGKSQPASARLSEDSVNELGYSLLRSKRLADAIEVFTSNVEDHPDSFNAYDSLGEAYAANGEGEAAIKNYGRSIELNPKNTGGIEALARLGAWPEWKGLVPGRYAVGFRVTVATDPTRTIRRSGGFSTGAKPDFGPRPMQVVVWYPAASATGGVPMTYKDYLPLLAWDAGTSREPDAARADAALKYIQAVTPLAGPPVQAEIGRLFGQRVLARKEAEPAPGRFPVLIYAPGYGYPAFDNSVMCEYLASHGYLVVASPSVGPDAKRMTGDAAGLEAQIRDLEFLAGQVRTWPQADADRVGTAGYSWGGLTSTLFALRYGGVRALISLDGVIRETSSLAVAKALHYNKPALLRVPTLVVTLSPELSLPDCNDSSFLDQVQYADVTTTVVPGLQHHDLVSLPSLLRRGSAPGQGKDWSAVTAGYVALCRLTRDFLDANLKTAGTAGPSSTLPNAAGLAVSFRKAEKAPPTPDDFRATLDSNGAAPAAELLRLMRRDFPDALAAFQSVVNEAGYELLGGGRFQDAITLMAANAECFPESLNASDSLGEAYLAAGDLDKSEQCYLDVKRKLEKTDTLSLASRARYAASIDAALARIKKQRGK